MIFTNVNVLHSLQNTAVLSGAILVTLLGMMLHIHFVKVDHESLLVIGSLGIQVSSSYASGRETTKFIEMSKIKDIVINEAIYMVRSCPCVLQFVPFCKICWLMTNAFIFSIKSSTTFVCCWRTPQSLTQCQAWCHCFRWDWMQSVFLSHKATSLWCLVLF